MVFGYFLPVSPAHPFQTGSAGVPDQKSICSSMLWTDRLFFIQAALHAACRCRFFHSLCATKQKRHKISQTLSPDMPFMIAFIYFLYAKRFLIRAFFYRYPLFRAKSLSSLLPAGEKHNIRFFCLIRADPLCVIKRYPENIPSAENLSRCLHTLLAASADPSERPASAR